VLAVVNTVLFRALPFASPDRLAWIVSVRSDNPGAPFTLPEFMDYRDQTRTLAGLAAYANWIASLAGDGETERLQGARMSANGFEVLGVTPAAGRLLNDADDRPDAPKVVVISHRLWQRRYGGRADAIGTTARINAEPFVVVGVMPAQFPLPMRDIDVVMPLAPDRDPLRHRRNSVNFLRLFGRLAPGSDFRQAQSELTAICRSLRTRFPVEYARKNAVSAVPLHEILVGDVRQPLLLLLAAVVLVLAAALANLVSLALVRATGRRAELSMRLALGASRLRLTRQLAIEALVLSAAGTSLGWLLASQAIAGAKAWAHTAVPRLGEATLDATAALLVASATAFVTVLLTAAPLGAVARPRAGISLRTGSRGAIGDRWNHRIRNVLVVAEISAALVLLLVTTVLFQNLRRLREVHPGFEPGGVFQARVSIPPGYRSPEDVARFYERLSERLASVPGVDRVGVVSVAPLSGLLMTVPFSTEGEPLLERRAPSANLRAISPDYLPTVRTRLLHGRNFSERDRSSSPPVAIVSAALAARFLSGRAVGRRLLIDENNEGPRPVEIVGVVENVRQSALDLSGELDVYVPLRQVHPDGVSAVQNQFWQVRLRSDAETAFRTTFVTHLRAVDPDAAISGAGPMRQLVDAWLAPRRFNLQLLGAFALAAVLLAVSGLYGLVSYAVSQRTQEIGVRMAIGATERDVSRMILSEAARLSLAGVAAGLALAATARLLISRFVPGATIDPAIALAISALLVAIALVAAWLPARRAARIEPTLALRAQ
jgi:putative ABC transport system permease protein